MVIELSIEVILAIITLVAGSFFWQIPKREKFLMRTIHDGQFLSQLISARALDDPSPRVTAFTKRLPQGYALNIQMVISSDQQSLRISKIILGSVAIAAFVGSYFLGVPYLVLNLVVFLLPALAGVSRQARANAAQQILALAVILDRWRVENSTECEEWVKQAWSLRPLYDAVKDARRIT